MKIHSRLFVNARPEAVFDSPRKTPCRQFASKNMDMNKLHGSLPASQVEALGAV
jgi:hypothetical protein